MPASSAGHDRIALVRPLRWKRTAPSPPGHAEFTIGWCDREYQKIEVDPCGRRGARPGIPNSPARSADGLVAQLSAGFGRCSTSSPAGAYRLPPGRPITRYRADREHRARWFVDEEAGFADMATADPRGAAVGPVGSVATGLGDSAGGFIRTGRPRQSRRSTYLIAASRLSRRRWADDRRGRPRLRRSALPRLHLRRRHRRC